MMNAKEELQEILNKLKTRGNVLVCADIRWSRTVWNSMANIWCMVIKMGI